MANPGCHNESGSEHAENYNQHEAHNLLQNNVLEQIPLRDPNDNIQDTTAETFEATMPSSSHQQPATTISAPEALEPSKTNPSNKSQKKPLQVHFCIPLIEGEEHENAKETNKPASTSMPSSHQKIMTQIFDDLLSDPRSLTQLVNNAMGANIAQENRKPELNTGRAEGKPVHVTLCIPPIEGEEAEKANKSASTSSSIGIIFGDLESERLTYNEPEKDDTEKANTSPKDTPPNEGEPSTASAPVTNQSKKNLLKRSHELFQILPLEDVQQRKKQNKTEMYKMEGDVAKKADKPAATSSLHQQTMEIGFSDLESNPLTSDQPEENDTMMDNISPNTTPLNEAEMSTATAPEAKLSGVSVCIPLMEEEEEEEAEKAIKPASVFSDFDLEPQTFTQPERNDTVKANTLLKPTPLNEAEPSTTSALKAKRIQVSFCMPLMEGEEEKEAKITNKFASPTSYRQTMEIGLSDLDLEPQTFTQPERNYTNTLLNEAGPSTASASKKMPRRAYFCIRSKKKEGDEAERANNPASTSQPSSQQESMTIFYVNLSSDPLMLSQPSKNKAQRGRIRLKTTPPNE